MKLKNDSWQKIQNNRSIRVLLQAANEGRLANALLLSGHSQSNLEQVTQHIAESLLNTSNPSQHPDFFALLPTNKMRQINVESIRGLVRDIQQSPSKSERKIAVIYEADRMNRPAANAFLKTLEEPPEDTTIILLTARPYELLDTIRSRCLYFRISCEKQSIEEPLWEKWLCDYKEWLAQLGNSCDSAGLILRLYGLIARFELILKHLSKVPPIDKEALTEEEIIAMEVGHYKTLRQHLLAEIECHSHMMLLAEPFCGGKTVNMLAVLISSLEHAVSLLNVNLNETAALEYFFLRTLQFSLGVMQSSKS